MASKKDFNMVLLRISSLIKNSNEYFSHQIALFIMGYLKSPPTTITIVSTNRRRNRQIAQFKIVFVSRKKIDIKHSQTVLYEGVEFVASILDKTMTDLVENLAYAPKACSLAQLFAQLPFNRKNLINLAITISDTVLKRVTFYLAWAGRVKFSEIPFTRFKRTPILIDSREKKGLIWLNYFFCKYPQRLLNTAVSRTHYKKLPENELLWMELKGHKRFSNYQFTNKTLIIRENPEQKNMLNAFFAEWLDKLTSEELDQILIQHFCLSTTVQSSFPAIFNLWLRDNEKHLLNKLFAIKEWVKKNITSENLDRIEAAMYFGLLTGLEDLVLQEFDKIGFNLFSSAKFKLIYAIADRFLKADKILPLSVYLTIAKTYTFTERYNDALNTLEEAKLKFADNGQLTQLGQLHHAAGIILLRLYKLSESITEIFMAREYFAQAKNMEMTARVECTIGNIYIKQGKAQSAMNSYKSSLSMARSANLKSLQASILGNIGIVEYDLGNFIKARYLLSQSYSLHKVMKNKWNASLAQLGIGKIDMRLGHFSKAIKIFRECHSMREKESNVVGAYETSCLLAWVYELLGKTAAARTWWNQDSKVSIQKLDNRAFFISSSLKAMSCLFKAEFEDALNQYNKMLEEAICRKASNQQFGDAQHGIAASKTFLGDVGAVPFIKQARKNIGENSKRIQLKQVNILASLYFPNEFKNISLDEELDAFVNSKCYDPFWWLFAMKLSQIKRKSAQNYLKYHISKTPVTTLNICIARYPKLKTIVQSISHDKARANEFVTFMTETETKPVHFDDYLQWQANFNKSHLVFDGPEGTVIFRNKDRKIKPGSIPHSLLSQLFLGYPHSLEIAALYETAWKMKYDADSDYGAFKSSLQRLKNYLGEICCPAEITREKTKTGKPGLKIFLPRNWTFIFK